MFSNNLTAIVNSSDVVCLIIKFMLRYEKTLFHTRYTLSINILFCNL